MLAEFHVIFQLHSFISVKFSRELSLVASNIYLVAIGKLTMQKRGKQFVYLRTSTTICLQFLVLGVTNEKIVS